MSKELGNIMSMSIDITNPMPFKIDKMDFREICMLVGPNGSGKSLVLKINWCVAMIANYFIIGKVSGTPINYQKEFQFILDNSFDDQNFNGKIEAFFENGTVTAELDNGKVTVIDFSTDEDLTPSKFPAFMSKDTRTFDSFIKYMKTKKLLGNTNSFLSFTEEQLLKLCDMYKLYDIMFIEFALKGLDGYTLQEDTKKMLKEDFNISSVIDQIIVNTDECEIYCYNKAEGTSTKITKLSAGEQLLLNMIVVVKVL